MGTIRTTLAAMLATLALVAYQADAEAQTRRSEYRTSSSSRAASGNTGVRRTAPGSTSRSSVARPSSGEVSKPSVNVERNPSVVRKETVTAKKPSASTDRKTATVQKPSAKDQKPAVKDSRPSATVNRPSSTQRRPAAKVDRNNARPSQKPDFRKGSDRPMAVQRPGNRPSQVRLHPRKRDFVVYDRPSQFWSRHDHCYGHRVRVLPSYVKRHVCFGVTYYCYNDIWYRPFGGYYVVCRPPFGTVLAADLIADIAWTAVRLSYYNTVADTFRTINENNEYIARQNEIIAQNNAVIAAQNQTIAMNQQLAAQAYSLANELGLVQSYAAADSEYYYQDGVFYVQDKNGEYKVIVPPAGALVEALPDDFDMVTLNGEEYYKVDDTVYRVTVAEGKPYFEVLGQMYS